MKQELREYAESELLRITKVASSGDSPEENKDDFRKYISRVGNLMKKSANYEDFRFLEKKREAAMSCLFIYYNSFVNDATISIPKVVYRDIERRRYSNNINKS